MKPGTEVATHQRTITCTLWLRPCLHWPGQILEWTCATHSPKLCKFCCRLQCCLPFKNLEGSIHRSLVNGTWIRACFFSVEEFCLDPCKWGLSQYFRPSNSHSLIGDSRFEQSTPGLTSQPPNLMLNKNGLFQALRQWGRCESKTQFSGPDYLGAWNRLNKMSLKWTNYFGGKPEPIPTSFW